MSDVTQILSRIEEGDGKAVEQLLPPVYEENSCVYIFTKDILHERKHRIGENPLLFEIDSNEALDIDTELDFTIAELLYKDRQKGR